MSFVGASTGVIHRQTATQVEITQWGTLFHQIHVVAAGFLDTVTDIANIRDLGADVIVHQLQAVQHIRLAQPVQHIHQLGHGQAKQ